MFGLHALSLLGCFAPLRRRVVVPPHKQDSRVARRDKLLKLAAEAQAYRAFLSLRINGLTWTYQILEILTCRSAVRAGLSSVIAWQRAIVQRNLLCWNRSVLTI